MKQTDSFNRKLASVILAFFWLSGIISGVWFVYNIRLHSLARVLAFSQATVPAANLLLITFAPVLVSVAIDYLKITYLLYPVCFVIGFQYSLALSVFHIGFANAGWLISFLVLFHMVLTMPALYLYWIHCIYTDRTRFSRYPVFFLVVYVIFVLYSDIHYILPFVGSLTCSTPKLLSLRF